MPHNAVLTPAVHFHQGVEQFTASEVNRRNEPLCNPLWLF